MIIQFGVIILNSNKIIIDRFKNIASLYPKNIAISDYKDNFTYLELDVYSEKICDYLYNKNIKNSVISVLMEPSFELIATLLGILKSGNTYIILNNQINEKEMNLIVNISKSVFTFTNTNIQTKINSSIININNIETLDITAKSITYPDIAYINFTSGTTGIPKGVQIKGESIFNLIIDNEYVHISSDDVISQLSNISFDAVTFEIWGAILNGAHLAIGKNSFLLNINMLSSWINKHNISIMFITTALLNKYVDIYPEIFFQIKTILFGGEKVNAEKINKLLQLKSNCNLVHVYGPTEATTFSTYYKITRKMENYPIGKAISGAYIYVMDDNMNKVSKGELYIGGLGVAKCYINEDNSKFLDDPFKMGYKLYKTGDIVELDSEENLIFIKRKDDQVKINGFRIEKQEIISKIVSLSYIKDAFLIIKNHNNENMMFIFYTGKPTEPKIILKDLSEILPNYKIPHRYIHMNELPLNKNNKIDEKTLKISLDDFLNNTTDDFVETLFKNNLYCASLHQKTNFFDEGGTSLSALKLISEFNKYFSTDLTFDEFFENPTINYLKTRENSIVFSSVNSNQVIEHSYEMSYNQKNFYYLYYSNIDKSAYNITSSITFTGNIDIETLKKAIIKTIRKFKIFSTKFSYTDSQFLQEIDSEVPINIIFEQSKDKIQRLINIEFDLKNPPLYQFIYNEVDSTLLLTIHHILTDGISNYTLFKNIINEYDYICSNENNENEVITQYYTYSLWQKEMFEKGKFDLELEYWIEELRDYNSNDSMLSKTELKSNTISTNSITNSQFNSINNFSQKYQFTNYMIFLAIYSIYYKKITKKNDFIIGIPVSGRSLFEFSDMIGPCVNTLPIRINFNKINTVSQLLKMIRKKIINGLSNQNVPFSLISQEIQLVNKKPIVSTMLLYNNFNFEKIESKFLNISNIDIDLINNSHKFHLMLEIKDHSLYLHYNPLQYTEKISLLFNKIKNNISENIEYLYLNNSLIEEVYTDAIY